jgi:transposase
MFALGSSLNYQLYLPGTDMRKSFDSLSGLVLGELGHRPDDGTVYIFINKARNKVKLLHWQSGGFVLYYKRLESGSFELPDYDESVGGIQLDYTQLVMLIDGISITNITRRKRYKNAG